MNTKLSEAAAKAIQAIAFNLTLLSLGLSSSPAHAIPANEPPQQEDSLDCFSDLQGAISNTPQVINLGQTATLRWNVTVPSSCTGKGVKLYVNNQLVSSTGSQNIQPSADTSYRLRATLPAVHGGGERTLATSAIKVNLPPTDPNLSFCPSSIYWDADRDGINDSKEDCLLNHYAPVLYMPFDYDWIKPANVDWYLARTTLRFHHNNCSDDEVLALGAVTQSSLINQAHSPKEGFWDGCDHKNWVIQSTYDRFFDEDQNKRRTTRPTAAAQTRRSGKCTDMSTRIRLAG